MLHVEFETSISADVPNEDGERLARLIEDFVNGISAIMPMPRLHAGVTKITPERTEQ